jgi:hypothetical protein
MYWVIETLLVQAGISHPASLRMAIGHIDSQGEKSGPGAPSLPAKINSGLPSSPRFLAVVML